MSAVEVLQSSKGQDCRLTLVRRGAQHFIVQVTDRDSMILRRRVTETRVFPVDYDSSYYGRRSAVSLFQNAARFDPVLVLPVASVGAAVEALEAAA